MEILVYLSISTFVLLIAFMVLLLVANSKSSNAKEVKKKQQGYNASVLRKHISAKDLDD